MTQSQDKMKFNLNNKMLHTNKKFHLQESNLKKFKWVSLEMNTLSQKIQELKMKTKKKFKETVLYKQQFLFKIPFEFKWKMMIKFRNLLKNKIQDELKTKWFLRNNSSQTQSQILSKMTDLKSSNLSSQTKKMIF